MDFAQSRAVIPTGGARESKDSLAFFFFIRLCSTKSNPLRDWRGLTILTTADVQDIVLGAARDIA